MADYKQISGAYFESSPTGLTAVSDPNTLNQLRSGSLASTATDFASATTSSSPTLNSANLSAGTIPFVSPTPSAPVTLPVTQPDPNQLSPEEQAAQTETERIQALNTQLGGESAFRTEQETAAGIPGLTKTQNELQQRVNILANEYKQAPLQVEQQFRGIGGVTASTVAGKTNDELRRVAIASLGANSLLEASRGNLTLAQDMVERAVSAKFSPIKEQIEIATRNLELALKSPAYTNAEKKRAQAQLDAQNAKLKAVEKQEAEQKDIWDIATTAAANGADASTMQAIQNAKTREEALQAAAPSLVKNNTQIIGSSETGFKLVAFDNNGKVVRVTSLGGGTGGGGIVDADTVNAYVQGIRNGTHKIGDVPKNMVGAVTLALAKGGADNGESVKVLDDKISLIDGLISHSGLNSSVGPNRVSRIALADQFGAAQDFAAGVHQLVNKETIDTLVNLKARGGTLGALSDQERILLQSAATRIGSWEIKDANNNPTGKFNIDQASFVRELNTIKELATRARENATGGILSTDEQEALNAAFNSSTFNPAAYFGSTTQSF